MDQTQNEFSEELEERIEHLFTAIDELRESIANGPVRRELLDRIFRYTHNIKGSAATNGLKRVSEIAHEFENLLVSIRSGRVTLDEPTLDSFEETAQLLLDQVTSTNRLVRRVVLSEERVSRVNSESTLEALPHELSKSLTEEERWNLAAALEEGSKLFIVSTSFDIHNFEEQFRQLQERLKSRGEIVSSSPIIRPEQPTRINFRIVYVSRVDLIELRGEFEQPPDVTLNFVGAGHTSSSGMRMGSAPPVNLIQVRLNDLDRLAASAHDLFAQTTDTLNQALAEKAGNENPKGLTESIDLVKQKFLALEDEIINLRMMCIGRTLQRAVRAGRAAARASKKAIGFEVSGTDIQMDKLLLNAISDPLIHLVRNAVDHGIEPESERLLLGKSRQGRVRIEVTSDCGQSVVTVSDDGRGINPEFISRAATKLGVIAEGATLTLEQSLRLIFRPGFSSVQSVSGVSGRGVGLDAVETSVEQAGGEVRVSTEVDKGTVFEIVLPVTFGLLDSTIIKSENYYYCLNTNLISGCEQIEDREVEATDGRLVWRNENESWPILHLRALLGHAPSQSVSGNLLRLVLCELRPQTSEARKTTPRRVGLIVDDIEGTEEVLVKGLGSHGGRWRGVAGATELRNGKVALVIDLRRLLRSV